MRLFNKEDKKNFMMKEKLSSQAQVLFARVRDDLEGEKKSCERLFKRMKSMRDKDFSKVNSDFQITKQQVTSGKLMHADMRMRANASSTAA